MDSTQTAVEEAQELEEVEQYYGKFESSVIVDMKKWVYPGFATIIADRISSHSDNQ